MAFTDAQVAAAADNLLAQLEEEERHLDLRPHIAAARQALADDPESPVAASRCALALVRSHEREHLVEAVRLLETLAAPGMTRAVGLPPHELHYLLALARYRLGDLPRAAADADVACAGAPGSLQAAALREVVRRRLHRDAALGLASVAVVGVGAVALLVHLLRRK